MASDELSASQAAGRIGATTRSVQRWIANGTLPARRVGGRWRVATDALDAFITGSPALTRPHASATDLAATGVQPIRHLFVANRGEIARRIGRTGDRLGIRVTSPETDGPGALDLLDVEAVVGAARAADADALHPGFGFLAENADFAAAVIAAGIRWVGPPPEAIRAMGDKAAARRLAASLGVPIIPGYDGTDQTDRVLAAAAGGIGFPILVKPASGGGGKGLRIVRQPEELSGALAAARREAAAAFRDDRLILEQFVEGPRHVEVQVLFDRHGHGVHLGERDCSIQRRHQKVLEESPSPAVDAALRERLGAHALALGRAVGYESAGTCEFLLTDRGEVFFLEMNTRLQVEHPVTELVSGRDLVADQLRIAAGGPLGLDQAAVDEAIAQGGHAVEVRLYAEDAERGFLPATGRVACLRWPSGEGIRVDAGIDEGDEVTGRFDPMLAKVIAHGDDRAAALERLAGALDRTVVLGLTTNLRFLRWLVRQPAVRDGAARIDTLDHVWPPADLADRTAIPEAAWAAAGRSLRVDGWRLNAPARVRLAADDGTERVVELAVSSAAWPPAGLAAQPDPSVAPEPSTVRPAIPVPEPSTVPVTKLPAVVLEGGTAHVDVGGRSVAIRVAPPPDVDRAAREAVAHHAGGPAEITAPMPGGVLAVHVDTGSIVESGDPIVTLEAMKMEHVVVSPFAGTVGELLVRRADQVARGQILAIVDP